LNDYHFKPDEVRVQVQIWDLECNQISAVSARNRQILARLSYKKQHVYMTLDTPESDLDH